MSVYLKVRNKDGVPTATIRREDGTRLASRRVKDNQEAAEWFRVWLKSDEAARVDTSVVVRYKDWKGR